MNKFTNQDGVLVTLDKLVVKDNQDKTFFNSLYKQTKAFDSSKIKVIFATPLVETDNVQNTI